MILNLLPVLKCSNYLKIPNCQKNKNYNDSQTFLSISNIYSNDELQSCMKVPGNVVEVKTTNIFQIKN